MTSRPRLRLGRHLLPGVIAIALFGVLAAAVLTSTFDDPTGFPEGVSIVSHIGYALFNVELGEIPFEGFLAAFLIVAIVLDAALDGAVMLARKDTVERSDEDVERSDEESGRPTNKRSGGRWTETGTPRPAEGTGGVTEEDPVTDGGASGVEGDVVNDGATADGGTNDGATNDGAASEEGGETR